MSDDLIDKLLSLAIAVLSALATLGGYLVARSVIEMTWP